MIRRGFNRMKFYGCCHSWFIHGHLNQDSSEVTWYSLTLTLVKMATSHKVDSILMRSSGKMAASHMVAIYSKVSPLGTLPFKKASIFLNKSWTEATYKHAVSNQNFLVINFFYYKFQANFCYGFYRSFQQYVMNLQILKYIKLTQ